MIITILNLVLISLIPIGASIGAKALELYTKIGKLPRHAKYIIIGVLFGGFSILGSVFGVPVTNGALINIRDAAPICAGLIFGGPCGLIAGCIGGIYRFISVYWDGSGVYTQLACSISTIMAGVITWLVRRFVFDNDFGKWYYGFLLGILCEIFHMLMVFFTHMNDVVTAYEVVKAVILPMMLINSLAVMLALIGVDILVKNKLIEKSKPRKISTGVQAWLIAITFSGLLLTSGITFLSLDNIAKKNIEKTMLSSQNDICNNVENSINVYINNQLEEVKTYADAALDYYLDTEDITGKTDDQVAREFAQKISTELCAEFSLSEVNIVNSNNIIIGSTNSAFIDFDMASGEQSKQFIELNNGSYSFIQEYGTITADKETKMKYAGIIFDSNSYNLGFIQIGYNIVAYHNFIDAEVGDSASFRHLANEGFVAVYDISGKLVSLTEDISPIKLEKVDLEKIMLEGIQNIRLDENYYYSSLFVEGYFVVSFASANSCNLSRNISFLSVSLLESFVFIILYFVVYCVIKHRVIDKITHINKALNKICDGDLNVEINERETYEFNSLSDDINSTVQTLKDYAEKEAKKLERELQFAKQIQLSCLPSTFPAFPNIHSIDIYASMTAAKTVGGDFYDFYLVDSKHIAIQIADVSGKGVPAAMFMMQTKQIIKNLVSSGMSIDAAYIEANNRLCEGNEAQMFVTAWIGLLNVETGHLEFINAGHNPIAIKHGNNKYEYLSSKKGFVLAALDGYRYIKQEINLNPGDRLFLYTDGVTEAANPKNNLYGEDKLLKVLDSCIDLDAKTTCEKVKNSVDEYSNGCEQADDITLLCLDFIGERNIVSTTIDAQIANVPVAMKMVETFLEKNKAPSDLMNKMDVVLDEVLSNIANYGYTKEEKGTIKIQASIENDVLELVFEDFGIPYNPLDREDPDITLSAEERPIGGLGILIVKKLMDDVQYKSVNGLNTLTLKKNLKNIK